MSPTAPASPVGEGPPTRVTIGVDVGGTHLRAARVATDGSLDGLQRSALGDRSPEAVFEAIAKAIAALGPEARELPVGVALAAQLNRDGHILVAPNLGWRDLDAAKALRMQLTGVGNHRLSLINDLDAAAWGEARCGAGRGSAQAQVGSEGAPPAGDGGPSGSDDLFLLCVGSGVGGGLVLGGQLHRGVSGIAGEIGHVKVEPGGRRCGCGERGCLEAYAGGHALAARAAELLEQGSADEALRVLAASHRANPDPVTIPGGHPMSLDAAALMRLAAQSAGSTRDLALDAADKLALAAANLVTVLAPAQLLLGGGVLLGSSWFYSEVEARLLALLPQASKASLKIARPSLGDNAGLVGAALLA